MAKPESSVVRGGTVASLPGAGALPASIPSKASHKDFAAGDFPAKLLKKGLAAAKAFIEDGFFEATAEMRAKFADLFVSTAKLAAAAVTPAKMAPGLKYLKIDGRNGAGAITATGAAIGDRVFAMFGLVTNATAANIVLEAAAPADFEATITVTNQLQQVAAGDLSARDYILILLPPGA